MKVGVWFGDELSANQVAPKKFLSVVCVAVSAHFHCEDFGVLFSAQGWSQKLV